MGYQTDLFGQFDTSRTLTIAEKKILDDFAEEDHNRGEVRDKPSNYCQWVPNEEGTAILWDQNEKFYNYVEWIEYLIKHFFEPWGVKLNGSVEWYGEESDDRGLIKVKDNVVKSFEAVVTYPGSED